MNDSSTFHQNTNQPFDGAFVDDIKAIIGKRAQYLETGAPPPFYGTFAEYVIDDCIVTYKLSDKSYPWIALNQFETGLAHLRQKCTKAHGKSCQEHAEYYKVNIIPELLVNGIITPIGLDEYDGFSSAAVFNLLHNAGKKLLDSAMEAFQGQQPLYEYLPMYDNRCKTE